MVPSGSPEADASRTTGTPGLAGGTEKVALGGWSGTIATARPPSPTGIGEPITLSVRRSITTTALPVPTYALEPLGSIAIPNGAPANRYRRADDRVRGRVDDGDAADS